LNDINKKCNLPSWNFFLYSIPESSRYIWAHTNTVTVNTKHRNENSCDRCFMVPKTRDDKWRADTHNDRPSDKLKKTIGIKYWTTNQAKYLHKNNTINYYHKVLIAGKKDNRKRSASWLKVVFRKHILSTYWQRIMRFYNHSNVWYTQFCDTCKVTYVLKTRVKEAQSYGHIRCADDFLQINDVIKTLQFETL
jgi:hypothetical protein